MSGAGRGLALAPWLSEGSHRCAKDRAGALDIFLPELAQSP